MGIFPEIIKTIDDLFMHTLSSTYYAEKQIVKVLPNMVEKASNELLKRGFRMHLEETKNQVVRLEEVFVLLREDAKSFNSPAFDGIIKEAEEVMSGVDDKFVTDVALIAAAQTVEHYEITRYGSLIAWAKELGHSDRVVSLLTQTLNEEKAADMKLTKLAELSVNPTAA